jgi:hypothetical protein
MQNAPEVMVSARNDNNSGGSIAVQFSGFQRFIPFNELLTLCALAFVSFLFLSRSTTLERRRHSRTLTRARPARSRVRSAASSTATPRTSRSTYAAIAPSVRQWIHLCFSMVF